MQIRELIRKKRAGYAHSTDEINFIVDGYVQGAIPDYQIAAWLMAVCWQGMTRQETIDLTIAMVNSGETVDLSGINGKVIDKHSTGGVGDKTTLVLAPLVAAAGVPVAKMSGRGLGHTGGTIDKLESIPGFNVNQSTAHFFEQVNQHGLAVIAQTAKLVPADGKLYALRDVTGTVESIPLIASSIMSKKIASGAAGIVLDVKVGDGAFMKTLDDARQLAETMVQIGEGVGRATTAVLTNMEQPLGYAVGNALEVREAITTLQGAGPQDLTELCLVLGTQMLLLAGISTDPWAVRLQLEDLLANGAALDKLKAMVTAQGGDASYIDEPEKLPQAKEKVILPAAQDGYISGLAAEQVGQAAMLLGAGREVKGAAIDPAVGVVIHKKTGDHVANGEALATIYANDRAQAVVALEQLKEAYRITAQPVPALPLILGIVNKEGTYIFQETEDPAE